MQDCESSGFITGEVTGKTDFNIDNNTKPVKIREILIIFINSNLVALDLLKGENFEQNKYFDVKDELVRKLGKG